MVCFKSRKSYLPQRRWMRVLLSIDSQTLRRPRWLLIMAEKLGKQQKPLPPKGPPSPPSPKLEGRWQTTKPTIINNGPTYCVPCVKKHGTLFRSSLAAVLESFSVPAENYPCTNNQPHQSNRRYSFCDQRSKNRKSNARKHANQITLRSVDHRTFFLL